MSSVSRRRFVAHAWVAALAPMAARLPDITPAQRRRAAVFPSGVVATRSPRAASLSTRIAPSGVGAASVTWAVARDRRMRDVVAGGRTSAAAAGGWLVHAEVSGLDAGTTYWFQFRTMGVTSSVGRIAQEAHDAPA